MKLLSIPHANHSTHAPMTPAQIAKMRIAEDFATRHGFDVRHILPDGTLEPHVAPAVPAWARPRATPEAADAAPAIADGAPARPGDPAQRESKRRRGDCVS